MYLVPPVQAFRTKTLYNMYTDANKPNSSCIAMVRMSIPLNSSLSKNSQEDASLISSVLISSRQSSRIIYSTFPYNLQLYEYISPHLVTLFSEWLLALYWVTNRENKFEMSILFVTVLNVYFICKIHIYPHIDCFAVS